MFHFVRTDEYELFVFKNKNKIEEEEDCFLIMVNNSNCQNK